jgi:hypothetical protein
VWAYAAWSAPRGWLSLLIILQRPHRTDHSIREPQRSEWVSWATRSAFGFQTKTRPASHRLTAPVCSPQQHPGQEPAEHRLKWVGRPTTRSVPTWARWRSKRGAFKCKINHEAESKSIGSFETIWARGHKHTHSHSAVGFLRIPTQPGTHTASQHQFAAHSARVGRVRDSQHRLTANAQAP